jgi:hypothetical protein
LLFLKKVKNPLTFITKEAKMSKRHGLDSLGAIIILEGDKFYRIDGEIIVNGNKEEVEFYAGFGWATDDELFEMRQKYPRLVP